MERGWALAVQERIAAEAAIVDWEDEKQILYVYNWDMERVGRNGKIKSRFQVFLAETQGENENESENV